MNKYFKMITKSVWGLMSVLVLVSCESDTWKDHYSTKSDGNENISSLAQTIASIPEASKFVQALKTTYMYNGDQKSDVLTYWDFLNDNQYLTVWLPDPTSITDAEWNEYLKDLDDPTKDHWKVGYEFILNHIARFPHPVGTDTHEKVKMMSNKTYRSVAGSIGGVGYKQKNERCTNGLLHMLDNHIIYRPNLYDYLTGTSSIKSAKDQVYDYKPKFGSWLAKFTKEELDEERSIPGEVNDKGEIEYIDKVVKRSNVLLEKYGYLDVEDSSYIVVMPKPIVWDSIYDTLSSYFSYEPEIADGDSLQEYWTNCAMITDAIFNRNIQKSILDSATSTQFKRSERLTEKYPYHVFSKPYYEGGLFADSTLSSPNGVIDSVICSNGVLLVRNDWPYSDSVFRRTIRIEGESLTDDKLQLRPKTVRYQVSEGVYNTARVMELSSSGDTYSAEYIIKDHLQGKYRIKLVFFHNTEEKKNSKIYLRVKYYALNPPAKWANGVVYTGQSGSRRASYAIEKQNGGDTIQVGVTGNVKDYVIDFPKGNYGMSQGLIGLQITTINGKDSFQKQTTKKLWLDCILLEPVFE